MKILNINNTKVVYHYLPSKLTNIQILTNVGSVSETKDEWGLAHMLEHNFFHGSKKYPNRLDIQTAANDIGGKMNAWTWLGETCYHISVLNDFFRNGFDILSDMYQNPLFPEEEFNKEINPILSEMRRNADNPEKYVSQKALSAMLGDEVGHPIVGTEDSIKSATLEKMKSFRNRYYGGKNVMLSVVGGIDEEEVVKVITELFNFSGEVEPPKTPVVSYQSGELSLTKPGITEAVYTLYYPALNRFHPNRYKQSLMTYILGGNDSGMLHERIREELGMSCYGIYASQVHFDTHNLLEVSAGIAPEQLEQCHNEVMNQIVKLMTDKIDDKRLARAKAALRTNIASASENSSGYNSSICIPLLKGETENPLEKLLAGVEATTIEDIRELAQQTFSVQPYKGILLPE